MHAYLDFTESAFADGLSKDVLAYFSFMRLQVQLSLRYPVHDTLLRLLGFILNFLLFDYFQRRILNLSIVFVSLVNFRTLSLLWLR